MPTMSTCSNCSKPVNTNDRKLQCDGCKRQIHMTCTDVSADDRVTRQRVRGLSILCNNCSSNVSNFSELKTLLDFKTEIHKKINDFDDKLTQLNNKLSQFDAVNSIEFTDNIANEAVDRIVRAKNIIIRGVPETSSGDAQLRKDDDTNKIKLVLDTVGCHETPITFYRVGKTNQKFPRMIKVVMPSEHHAKNILRNKSKLLEEKRTEKFSIIDDKTPTQQQRLRELRSELDTRKNNGEHDLTIRYTNGIPKISKFRS